MTKELNCKTIVEDKVGRVVLGKGLVFAKKVGACLCIGWKGGEGYIELVLKRIVVLIPVISWSLCTSWRFLLKVGVFTKLVS